MKTIFAELNKVVGQLESNGYEVGCYAKEDIENKRTDREIVIYQNDDMRLVFDKWLVLYTNFSNREITDEFIMKASFLKKLTEETNSAVYKREFSQRFIIEGKDFIAEAEDISINYWQYDDGECLGLESESFISPCELLDIIYDIDKDTERIEDYDFTIEDTDSAFVKRIICEDLTLEEFKEEMVSSEYEIIVEIESDKAKLKRLEEEIKNAKTVFRKKILQKEYNELLNSAN